MQRWPFMAWPFMFFPLLLWICNGDQSFFFRGNFSNLELELRGSTRNEVGTVLLTEATNQTGRCFYKSPVQLLEPITNKSISFNTTFTFQITTSMSMNRTADGMTFLLAPTSILNQNISEAGGACLGFHCKNDIDNHLFGIEFDIFQNDAGTDPNNDHLAVDVNTIASLVTAQLGQNSAVGHNVSVSLLKNMSLQAWIEYKGGGGNRVQVWLAEEGSPRPDMPHIDYNVNLEAIILPTMYVGFSGSTSRGTLYAKQTISSWTFAAGEVDSFRPKPAVRIMKTGINAVLVPSLVVVALVFVLGLALLLIYKKKKMKKQEGLAMQAANPLVSFTFKELHSATKGFKEPIGKGGSCIVYKGFLQSSNTLVAVKVLTQSAPSEQQFLAELNVITKLRHQKLVALRGWCNERDNLLLVYEYMSRGSLEQVLFNKETTLSWRQRYEIIRSVAEGLAYLHEGLEQSIVHRDVKAANVLLDDNMCAKLGDFGLARLMQSKDAQTMTRAGTLGYISPELAYTGRATEKSDVYSFGVLVLEVVSGRKALEETMDDRTVLLDWVRRMNQADTLLDVLDSRVQPDCRDRALVLIRMGLLCCSMDATDRPTMRKCCQVLTGDAELPAIPRNLGLPARFFDMKGLYYTESSDMTFSSGSLNVISSSSSSTSPLMAKLDTTSGV